MPGKRSMAPNAVTMLWMVGAVVLGILIAQWLPRDFLGLRTDTTATESARDEAPTDGELWTCGMHPQVLEEAPGSCPICGMDLTPMQVEATAGTDVESEAGVADEWTCADHPFIVENEPGECPIDGLELISDSGPATVGDATTGSDTGSGMAVTIDPGVIQNMNVRTESAARRDLAQPIRTVGYLEYDAQRMVTVTTKNSGWVEKVYVNYVGEKVRRGQPLFEIYSPDLVQTEQDLLAALKFAEEMKDAPEDARRRASSMVDSARIRLGYWDISPQQIAHLEATGEVFRTLEVRAPADGLVMKRMPGLEGMAVNPGMEIFHIADLSSMWLSVELFEDQVAWVQEGTVADIDLSYFPGESFRGKVRFLEPELSEKTRTMKAKIEVPNPGGRLRKGMFATVSLQPVKVHQAVTVPSQAVLRTGRRNLVVVSDGDGRFSPREVILGHESEGFAEIRQGLSDGERVVTSAQFLLDSESKLREAVQKMISERRSAGAETAPGHHHGH